MLFVAVYHDPRTQEQLEGFAILKEKMEDKPDHEFEFGGKIFQYRNVKFIGDEGTYGRWIEKPNPNNAMYITRDQWPWRP